MKAGFIGLGNMGQPMARNLLKAGHTLTVYNRTPSRAYELAGAGAQVAGTLAEACAPGLVLTMLADDRAVEECVFAGGGIREALPARGVHVSLSTISTALSGRLSAAHQERGQSFVAAPVFGRPDAAAAARLVVVAAGPAEALDLCRPLLEAVGRKLFVIGTQPPMANTFKLAGNFLIFSALEALAEAFALLRKAHIDPAEFLDIMNGSFFQSPVIENYGKIILEQKFEPVGFELRLGLKDVRLLLAAADEAGAPMPIASLVHDNLLSGVARGLGHLDWSALARIVAEKAGLQS
jgi:3-hydroxyisobutyrate dehydrogenase-like beta-hydroxyacid dehydrogenase